MKSTIIPVDNGNALDTMRNFLEQLLKSEFLEGIMVPMMLPGGDGFVQSLVTDPAMLKNANPVAPTIAVQSAKILSDLTSGPEHGFRIGAVLKPCELRAAVELVKFLQINPNNLVFIGTDCLGTYEVRDYTELAGNNHKIPDQVSWEGVEKGVVKLPEEYPLREACHICEYPVPPDADISIGFIGFDPSREILVMTGDRFEKELGEKLALEFTGENSKNRKSAIEALTAQRKKNRKKAMAELKGRTGSMEELLQVLSTCIRCHNCMEACPICYCKECVFKSTVFEHDSRKYMNRAARKGAVRMPTDTLIFHLTRLSHMATSCIGCGMCTSACPNQLPVTNLFRLMGSELQEMFEYVPGRSIDEEPPVSVFKENELQAETGSED